MKCKRPKQQPHSSAAHLKRRLLYGLMGLWLAFGLTGVGLLWSGHLSTRDLQSGIYILRTVMMPCVRLLIEGADTRK